MTDDIVYSYDKDKFNSFGLEFNEIIYCFCCCC